MGASLGPHLANIIMTEYEKVIVDNLVNERIIKFYVPYVDGILLLFQRQHIEKVLKAFNGFDKNLKFTVDRFESESPHFLELEICTNGIKIFLKNTHTGQYINMDSFTLWKRPESDHLLIEQRKYVQNKTFEKNSN